jgi:spore maturation protein SpmB
MAQYDITQRIGKAWRESYPKATSIARWMIKLTVIVSFCVELMRYFGVIRWLSESLYPVFQLIGLPGEAALAFLTGYFVNVYGAIAVIGTLTLSVREITILGIMVLCAHNMFVEPVVQQKTGSSLVRMLVVRTLGALAGGFIAHSFMPAETAQIVHQAVQSVEFPLPEIAWNWVVSTFWLMLRMFVFILALSFLQRLLAEFGVIRWLSKILRPVLKIFGLPARTSFLWIVANVLGLAYGAAVMIEESQNGKIDRRDVDLLNHHVGVSHSNLEDLLLLVSFGASMVWLLGVRWALAMFFVWERRLELRVRKR